MLKCTAVSLKRDWTDSELCTLVNGMAKSCPVFRRGTDGTHRMHIVNVCKRQGCRFFSSATVTKAFGTWQIDWITLYDGIRTTVLACVTDVVTTCTPSCKCSTVCYFVHCGLGVTVMYIEVVSSTLWRHPMPIWQSPEVPRLPVRKASDAEWMLSNVK